MNIQTKKEWTNFNHRQLYITTSLVKLVVSCFLFLSLSPSSLSAQSSFVLAHQLTSTFPFTTDFSNSFNACDADAGYVSIPRIYFNAEGNAAGNTKVDAALSHQNAPSPIEDYTYIYYIVDDNLNIIHQVQTDNAADGTTEIDLAGVSENNYNVYGVIILTDDLGMIPGGDNLQALLDDIDACNICGAYVNAALESDVCVPSGGNTPILDGAVAGDENYTLISQYPFAAPIGANVGESGSDETGENSAFLYYENMQQESTSFGADADIQNFHLTYDDNFIYLVVEGPDAFIESPPRSDEMDLFIAIDTDNSTGSGINLSNTAAPANKRVDFAGWSPDYFVMIETVNPNGADLATLQATGGILASDTDDSSLSSTTSFDFTYEDEVTEIRIPWSLLGGTPDSSTGETWNFAIYTTYDEDGFDVFDAAPAIGGGTVFELLGDDPLDADYCDTAIDPVTGSSDNGCMNCESDDNLGSGSNTGGGMMTCDDGLNRFPASDDSDGDFDTIEEYFQVHNIGQLEDVCCENPEISRQPTDVRACDGTAVGFTVTATGVDLSYQWQISNNGTDFTNLSNAGIYSGTDTDALDISSNSGLDGRFFKVEITADGGCTTISDTVRLIINPAPIITAQPSNHIACPGEAAQFSVSASGTSLTYQWQSSTNGINWSNLTNGTLYSNVNGSTLFITNNSTLNGRQFRVIITQNNSPDPDCSTTSDVATLIQSDVPLITEQPVDAVTCGQVAAFFNVTASGNNLSYQWQISSNNINWSNLSNNTIYSGVNTASLTINNTNNLLDRYYRVIVTENNASGATCMVVSDAAQLIESTIDFSNCNNEINLTLGSECNTLITPDLVLEGDYNHDDFEVELTDLDGNPIPNPVDPAFACTRVIVTVTDNCSGSSCWGYINLEDKSKPIVQAPDDLMEVACDDIDFTRYTFAILNASNTYSATDNCSNITGTPMIEFGPITGDICELRQVVVTYSVTDDCGNTGSDTQIIFFRRPHVVIPSGSFEIPCASYNGNDNACRPYLDFDGDGNFDNGTDLYLQEGELMCNFGLVRVLNEFDNCADGVKKVYSYTVFDWCSQEDGSQLDPPAHPIYGNQANPSLCDIKVQDQDDPRFICPLSPLNFVTGDFDCTAQVNITPNVVDDCKAVITTSLKNIYKRNDDNDFELVDPEDYTIISANDPTIRFTGLECGSYYAEVIAEDECGNSTDLESEQTITERPNCNHFFNINDEAAPVAICDDNKSVSLNDNCAASIPAPVFDSGSYDNCMLAESPFSVAKLSDDSDGDGLPEPNDFGPTVSFGASDLDPNNCPTQGIMVVLRVNDAKGHFSYCMVEIELEDKVAPVCDGNESRNLSCATFGYLFDEETTDADITTVLNQQLGQPGGNDNCNFPVTATDVTVTVTPSDCGQGTIRRRYRVEDICGNRSGFCTQTLNISGSTNWKMTFPLDAVIECTKADDIPRPLSIDEILVNNGCDQWAMSIDSSVFEFEEDACYKLIREYKFINWCTYTTTTPIFNVPRSADLILSGQGVMLMHNSPNQNNAHIVYQQIIKVTETTNPDIDFSYTENCDDDGDCEEQQIFDVKATDPCSPMVQVNYYFIGDLDNNGSAETSFQNMTDTDPYGNLFGDNIDYSIIGTYPLGQHQFVIQAEDICGHITTETFDFSVSDCDAPTITCVEGFTANLTTDGTLVIDAAEFIEESSDNCTDVLRFSFTANPEDELLQLDCDDLGSFSLNIFAFDQDNNQDVCSSFLVLGPSTPNTCSTGSGSSAIAGIIATEDGEAVANVSVQISGNLDASLVTSVDGSFAFNNVEPSHDYSIIPGKNLNPSNGVSTFDMVLIRKHILNLEFLDSPYKMIAADVNNSQSITTFDMVGLRKLILNVSEEFNNNSSWRFIDANYTFPDPTNPWAEPFPEILNINDLSVGLTTADFVAVKIGDVNTSAIPNNLAQTEARKSNDTFPLYLENKRLKKGETFSISFEADITELAGLQFTLNFNTHHLDFIDFQEDLFQKEHVGLHLIEEGILTASWNGDAFQNSALFHLVFKAKTDGFLSDFLELSSQYTASEAYSKTDNSATHSWFDLSLNFYKKETLSSPTTFELFPNRPNPFNESTVVGFYLPKKAKATLTILDISGQVLKTIEGDFSKGYNEVVLHQKDLGHSGVLYYQLKTGNHMATRKMVVLP